MLWWNFFGGYLNIMGKKENLLMTLKNIFTKRRIELIAIDSFIMAVTFILMIIISKTNITSMKLNGTLEMEKAISMYICIMLVRFAARVYNSIWRYADTETYLKLILADIAGGLGYFLLGRIFTPISMGFAYTLTITLLVILVTLMSRFVYQFLYSYMGRIAYEGSIESIFGNKDKSEIHKINIAIVGAGNIGATLAGELIRNPSAHYHPYCFIDTDTAKIGSDINGIRVYPEDDKIVDRLKAMPVQEIVIAIPEASPENITRLYNLYKKTGCKVKIYDYPLDDKNSNMYNKSSKMALRDFRIEDLLFRETLNINSAKTKGYYKNKTVLVTGGGGSIGSELCRQLATLGIKKLCIVDIYENNAYDIQQELVRKYGNSLNLETIIASVRDVKRLDEIFAEIRPDIVFHAAAHKHVPLMEQSGCEAIKNNVYGTYNTANMAEKYAVEKFVLISTDKAVNPTNIMGASKRLCEMVIQSRVNSKTEFTAVRFGNVLGSNG